ncbi:hypothetical protein G5V57_00130 [Nordella sp. HKS 07]|uniref:hypothetical protein n=1 Tax=Nordella sp. HKS 07 TaxID=2712222 RepID=UPI0013E16C7C|nr:hypothetical protein [Nordella sp. HKS 07]QIG46305.1 hypothetical protein G5V57_00130 [Nordella sp. HKS 07]
MSYWLAAISRHQQADRFSIALSVLGIQRKAIPFNSMSSLSGDVLEHGFPIIIFLSRRPCPHVNYEGSRLSSGLPACIHQIRLDLAKEVPKYLAVGGLRFEAQDKAIKPTRYKHVCG